MATKTTEAAEFGDYQTPNQLAGHVCRLLTKQGVKPVSLLEPTCGVGAFFFAGLEQFKTVTRALGADINHDYIASALEKLQRCPADCNAKLVVADFFATDWATFIADLPEPILVLGNLPWVTNSQLSGLGSRNLPAKSNYQNRSGIDAITGKANFDISEWMLVRLLEALQGRRGTLAMLCKASVARKALHHGWKNKIAMDQSAIYRIDANLHFNASVDAALLVTHFTPRNLRREAKVYPFLSDKETPQLIAYEDDVLIADLAAYRQWKQLCGEERIQWRSGIKHDCSRVMELRREGRCFRNGIGKLVDLDEDYLYPMLKSSDVAKGCRHDARRWMIVTQKRVGEDTAPIENRAPRTWRYLMAHAELLSKRRSSIYRGRPIFSIFGVGDYSFAPWKVAISGFYKKLEFHPIGTRYGKPVVLDDTSYFLPCESEREADFLAGLLNSPTAQAFYNAFVFWDNKSPITVQLLRRLDLRKLAEELGEQSRFNEFFAKRQDHRCRAGERKRRTADVQARLFPDC